MTAEIHRPYTQSGHHHLQYDGTVSGGGVGGGMSTMMPRKSARGNTSSSRKPLQARNPNTFGAQGSFNNSSNEEFGSKELNRLSSLESSGNENNKRMLMSSATSQRSGNGSSLRMGSDHESDRGIAIPTSMSSSTQVPTRSNSVSKKSNSVSQRSSSLPMGMGDESVIIEEKRRKLNGEGYTIHRYVRGRLLGKGGFAKVYVCTALDTNKSYAIKIVPKANLVKQRARQKLQAEIKIHRTLKHRHVCEYKHFFEDRQNCYILLELCHNQSMNEMIKRRKRLTEPEAAFFMHQLLEAINYLHDQYVIHRDLKLGNLFLDKNLNIKVGDLGLATRLESPDEKRKTICGTPNYIAPEVIQGDRATRGHSFEVDIWSIGVILYTSLIGKPPYEAKDVKATYQRILANEYSFPSHIPISDNAKDIIRSMLQSKPKDRPSLAEIGDHPFLNESSIPVGLPSNATHVAPVWKENDYGELVVDGANDPDTARKACLPRAASLRRPFAHRDLNVPERNSERLERSKPVKPGRDIMDVPGVVKNALSAVMNVATQLSPATTPNFQVYDETKPTVEEGIRSERKTPQSRSPDDDVVTRTAALSIRAHETSPYEATNRTPSEEVLVQSPTGSNSSTAAILTANAPSMSVVNPSTPEQDAAILCSMMDRIKTVLEITESRTYSPKTANSLSMTPFSSGGPTKWVSRYVDYTSKYGLGFLLNDGSSGVYFNDSTKTVLEAEGDNFQYIERRRIPTDGNQSRKGEPVIVSHTLESYPVDLQKKVTLLKHFRNYLIEQQKKADEDEEHRLSPISPARKSKLASKLVYLKKWLRTKHAIFFRLSDQTVQIVFYDHTEILLTPDDRHITYVDKNRVRNTYFLTDELVGCNPEIAKRLKYTKEILQQLVVAGQRR